MDEPPYVRFTCWFFSRRDWIVFACLTGKSGLCDLDGDNRFLLNDEEEDGLRVGVFGESLEGITLVDCFLIGVEGDVDGSVWEEEEKKVWIEEYSF